MWNVLAKPLTGSLVSLEPLEERHVADLRAAATDPRVSQWLPVPLHEPDWFARGGARTRPPHGRRGAT